MSKNAWLAALGAILLIAVGLAIFAWYLQQQGVEEAAFAEAEGRRLAEMVGAQARSGDLDGALQSYESLLASTDSARESAPVILAGSSLRFRVSGNTADAVRGIQELKQVAESDVRPFIRAQAILNAVYAFYNSGSGPVFREIFKDDPYASLLVQTGERVNTAESLRNLLLYSYDVWPTYQAAIAIAESYALSLYRSETVPTSSDERARAISAAEEYLARAEDLVTSGEYEQARYEGAREMYLSQRAFVIGALAHFKGESYKKEMREAYADLFQALLSTKNAQARSFRALSHAWYAMYLIQVDNDSAAARAQLKESIAAAKADENFSSNPLVVRIREEKRGVTAYAAPASFKSMAAISTEFATFVAEIE